MIKLKVLISVMINRARAKYIVSLLLDSERIAKDVLILQ